MGRVQGSSLGAGRAAGSYLMENQLPLCRPRIASRDDSRIYPPLKWATGALSGALSGVANVRPQQSPVTAPLSARDWAKYLVQERASKQQKVRDSPATEPARPSDGRFKVWHSPAVEKLTELT